MKLIFRTENGGCWLLWMDMAEKELLGFVQKIFLE